MGVILSLLQVQLLSQDPGAAQVFKFISQKSAASGWNIVKELGQDAEQTEESLNKLRSAGLLEGDGAGLDGYYHLTSLGYAANESSFALGA